MREHSGFIFFGVYERCLQLLQAAAPHSLSQLLIAGASRGGGEESARRRPEAARAETAGGGGGGGGGEAPEARLALLAGGLAGTATDVILYPIDTVKTRLISGRPLLGSSSLWSGIGVSVMPAIPAAATFFTVYEATKHRTARLTGADPSDTLPSAIAAALAESFSCVVRVPFEQLKMRMQVRY